MGVIDFIKGKFGANNGAGNNPLQNVPDDQIFIEANKRSGGSDINMKVVKQAPSGRIQDIGTLKQALRAAQDPERPDRTLLYNSHDNTLLDGHLTSVIETRILRVLGSKFKIVNEAGENNPDLVRLFEREWFEECLRLAMWSTFKGTRLIEISEILEGEITEVVPIPERNVDPKNGRIVKQVGQEEGWNYRKPPLSNYIIEVGMPDDLGLLIKCAPYAIFKRYAMGAWSDYQEKFGVPPRWVKTNTTDKKRHKALMDMMANLVSSAYAVFQGDEEIESMDVKHADAHETFDKLIARCNSEISKIILGQDGTTDNKDASGTYGSLKVLQGVAEDRHKYDKTRMMHLINRELIPRMQLVGYSGLAGHRFVWDDFQELTAKEVVAAVKDLSQSYEFDWEQLAQRTGLPIIGLRRLPGEEVDGLDPGDPKPDSIDSAQDKPEKKKTDLNARISALYDHGHDHGITAEAIDPKGLRELVEAILRDLFDRRKKGASTVSIRAEIVTTIGKEFSDEIARAIVPETGSEFRHDEYNNRLRDEMRNNAYAFSAAKTYQFIRQLQDLLQDDSQGDGIKPWSQFKDEALNLHETYNVAWLQSEYNHVVAASQMAANWSVMEGNKDVLPNLTYNTAGDDRVRPDHALLDGITRPIDDPFWDTYYAPNDWGCRCDVTATSRTPLTDATRVRYATEQQNMKPMFRQNVGKTGKVFPENHPYFDDIDASMYDLSATDHYGMPDATSMLGMKRKSSADPKRSNFDDWWKAQRKRKPYGDDSIELHDYNANALRVDRSAVAGNRYASHMERVISQPGEVWRREGETTYIKYHKTKAMSVTVQDRVVTRYDVYDEFTIGAADQLRRGVIMWR